MRSLKNNSTSGEWRLCYFKKKGGICIQIQGPVPYLRNFCEKLPPFFKLDQRVSWKKLFWILPEYKYGLKIGAWITWKECQNFTFKYSRKRTLMVGIFIASIPNQKKRTQGFKWTITLNVVHFMYNKIKWEMKKKFYREFFF